MHNLWRKKCENASFIASCSHRLLAVDIYYSTPLQALNSAQKPPEQRKSDHIALTKTAKQLLLGSQKTARARASVSWTAGVFDAFPTAAPLFLFI